MRKVSERDRSYALLVTADSFFSANNTPINRANAFANRKMGHKNISSICGCPLNG